MALGLVSLLISVAIILWLMVGGNGQGAGYMQTVAKTNKQLKSQVNVIGGKDPTGQMLATQSIHMRIDRSGSRSKVIISEVMAGGPMEVRYGFKPNDQLVEIGALDVNQSVGGHEDAEAFLHDAYARDWPVVVLRGGQRISLPTPQHVALVAKIKKEAEAAEMAANAAAATAAAPPPAAPPERSGLQKALDAIRTTPGN